MIGLIDSAVASIAFAPPMRPFFFRFSRVSRAAHTFVREERSFAMATRSPSDAPLRAAFAHATATSPMPIDADAVSTISTGTETPACFAPSSALCMVAESFEEMLTTRIPVAPEFASVRYASAN